MAKLAMSGALAVALCLCAPAVMAATVLSISGPDTDAAPVFRNSGAFAVSFTVDGPITGADIFVDYTCFDVCSGSALLLDDFGPSSSILAAATYDGSTDLVLSNATLIDGLNVLLLTVDDGIIAWNDTATPTIVSELAEPRGSFVSTDYNDSLPWNSDFSALFDTALKYRIETSVVPLPTTALLLGTALLGAGAFARRRAHPEAR